MDGKPRSNFPDGRKRDVYALIPRDGVKKDKWVRCGIGFVNNDESITLMLDTFPMNGGKLNVRRYETMEERERNFALRRKQQDGSSSSTHDFPGADPGDALFGPSH